MRSAGELTQELEEAVARRQAFDPASATDEELRQYVLESDRLTAQIEADHARVLAAADGRRVWAADGDRSCAAWVARKRRRPKHAVSASLGLGRCLTELPLVAVALHEGRISPDHARELLRCWRFAPDAFAEWESEAVGHAETHTWANFLRLTTHWRNVVNPDGAEDTAAKNFDRRHLTRHRRYDGTLTFSGVADTITAEVMLRVLEAVEAELLEADWKAARAIHGEGALTGDLPRTHAQRSLDALRIICERAIAAAPGDRLPVPNMAVYIGYETLTGALCELSSGQPITPGQAASLFEDEPAIDIERIVFGPGNRIIELSKRERFYRGGLRRAIVLRDRQCTFEGCDVPAERCHIDHDVDYADGGETTQENGRAACDPHNIHKDRFINPPPGWRSSTDERPDTRDETHEAAIRARVRSLIDRPAA